MLIEQGHDISYNGDNCTVLHNDRLLNDTESIARLQIQCADAVTDGFDIANTMDSETTKYVDHLSATMVEIVSNSSTYYPGELLQIDYVVMDRMGTVIDIHLTNTTIWVRGDSFFSSLRIDDNGVCDSCGGIWISDVSIANNVGKNYTLQIDIDNDQLVQTDNILIIDVTGCPMGYGADSKNYSCTLCDTDSYNVDDDFVGQCHDCDSSGVQCESGKIIVSQHYWMGFKGNTIISTVCPSVFCCRRTGGCDYISDKDSLCATNRNSDSLLCSECIEGYSESINSENCTNCDRDHWEYLLLPFAMAVFTTGILLFTNRESKPSVLKRNGAKFESILETGGGRGTITTIKRLSSGKNKIVLMSMAKIAVYYMQVKCVCS